MHEFGPTDITVVLGTRGCGKSSLCAAIASVYPRRIIIDKTREHSNDGLPIYTDIRALGEFLRKNLESKAFAAIVQFLPEQSPDIKDEIAEQVIALTYRAGELSGLPTALIIEEVQFFAPNRSMSPWLLEASTTSRHANLAIICNSQRPALVSKTLISQANHIIVGSLFERGDREYLIDCVGEEVDRCASLPKFRFLHFKPGQAPIEIESPPLN